MIDPDRARRRLDERADEDWRDRALTGVASLPKSSRAAAWLALGRRPDGSEPEDDDDSEDLLEDLQGQIETIGEEGRRPIWGLIFPGLGADLMEATWLGFAARPYNSGYDGRPFRAPGIPGATLEARSRWLEGFIERFAEYHPDLPWLAAWAGYLDEDGEAAWPVLAAAIDTGGESRGEVMRTFRESVGGEHEVGFLGQHLLRALQAASNPEGWDIVESLLLGAGRQEGLRRSILGPAARAHPDAFRRLLRLVVEHDLTRFASASSSVLGWFGPDRESGGVEDAKSSAVRVLRLFDAPGARDEALASGGRDDISLALWSIACADVARAVEAATGLLDDRDAERRLVAARFLNRVGLDDLVLPARLKALEDPDIRVALAILQPLAISHEEMDPHDLFERFERLLARLPGGAEEERAEVIRLLPAQIGDRPPSRMLPYLDEMRAYARADFLRRLAEADPGAPATHELLLKHAVDREEAPRRAALEALANIGASPEEIAHLEALLVKKREDLRDGVIAILARQDDAAALASVDRLLSAKKPEARPSGVRLLVRLVGSGRAVEQCRERARRHLEANPGLEPEEAKQLRGILDPGGKPPSRDDALGLVGPEGLTLPLIPTLRNRPWMTPAGFACLRSLSALIDRHRQTMIPAASLRNARGDQELQHIGGYLPMPDPDATAEEDARRLPLLEIWESWYATRTTAERDADGLELIRAIAMCWAPTTREEIDEPWPARQKTGPISPWYYPRDLLEHLRQVCGKKGIAGLPHFERTSGSLVDKIATWLVRLHPPRGAAGFLLDAMETGLALVPPEELAREPNRETGIGRPNWREYWRSEYLTWARTAEGHREHCGDAWSGDEHVRYYRLMRWADQPGPPVLRDRAGLEAMLPAIAAGGASVADIYDHLLGPDGIFRFRLGADEFKRLTAPAPPEEFARYPFFRAAVARAVARIVELEIGHDEPTAAAERSDWIQSLRGSDTLLDLVRALGERPLDTYSRRDRGGKARVLSHMIRVCLPAESDTPEAFAAGVEARSIAPSRLVELAVYLPHWAWLVEPTLGWPGFEEGVWWIHAHTRSNPWGADSEINLRRAVETSTRTPLAAEDRAEGAVDVAWFSRVHEALGQERWAQLDEAAKYAWGGKTDAHVRLFADAILGRVDRSELIGKIREKEDADSVKALGLIPLATGRGRGSDLLERYEVIQEFARSARKAGAKRRETVSRATAIGLANLARTAGYPDPIRLEWAMEARAVADLAAGPVTAEAKGVVVSLALDDQAEAELTVSKAGKTLAAIPPAAKKAPEIAALVERRAELKRQSSRVRTSLEAAMCRGDAFTGAELEGLAGHAILAPLLAKVVLVGDRVAGYPVEGGHALRDHAGRSSPIGRSDSLRIAHPHDLLALGDWHLWQRECFDSGRVQPFKQVFRELYPLTELERAGATHTERYSGQEVHPKQARGLLGSRGWIEHYGEGVRKTYHDADLTVHVDSLGGSFLPDDGDSATIESVAFCRRGRWAPIPLAEVPPRLFSEAMRDLDLVVSVAHRSDVDPEASTSTVAMRADLLRETARLLRLDNVRVEGPRALIAGSLGNYSLHLGSAVVHRQPGGSICIVAVPSQHRGRLFLPFADDDPRTAEILAKALLLARDGEIRDPTILAQLRGST